MMEQVSRSKILLEALNAWMKNQRKKSQLLLANEIYNKNNHFALITNMCLCVFIMRSCVPAEHN